MRIASDSLGEIKVPRDAYYSAQTQRAVHNFPISGLRLPRAFIKAQGLIKASAAAAHLQLGEIPEPVGRAIIQAAEEVAEGKWDDQFVVDVYQAGAGTSQNMNANEVIANRALEILGKRRDQKEIVHPNDHVNKGQSTNDTIPTAIYISTYDRLTHELLPVLSHFHDALLEKAEAFHPVLKSGRTHLQDAVPLRLGHEFAGYAGHIRQIIEQLEQALSALLEIGIGGNAVGTGVNTHPEFADRVLHELRKRTDVDWKKPRQRFSFMQNPEAAMRVSGILKELAVHLIKISSDLRLLNSGPNTGLAEIRLPAVQPGSSIMPGKVNPVLPEMVYMVSSQVIGNDTVITTAMQGSQLEINVMMPVIAYNLLQSIQILSRSVDVFTAKCIKGIEANSDKCRDWMEQSLGLVTLLNPLIGYDRAAQIAYQAVKEGKSIKEAVLEQGGVTEGEWDRMIEESVRPRS
ncbi:MAG: aspartate ammonia-lyase [Bacillaceae bacterium]|nr:aspartate ammonia-lyase [Bacillaceae bacterium]